MDQDYLLPLLETNATRISALVQGLSAGQARWRPDPQAWSILEVINHLADEEQLDFRVRIDYVLHRPGETPPPIDPQAWVTQRRYNERDLEASLQHFLNERQKSLDWLRSLVRPAWDAVYEAPWGQISAGDFMASWAAHDLLHMRQLIELHYLYTVQVIEPKSVQYAGDW